MLEVNYVLTYLFISVTYILYLLRLYIFFNSLPRYLIVLHKNQNMVVYYTQ